MKKVLICIIGKEVFWVPDKLSKDWIAKNGQKLKEAYSFAVASKHNIKSEEDVLKILKLIDPKNANSKYAKMFSRMLQLFGVKLNKSLNRRQIN